MTSLVHIRDCAKKFLRANDDGKGLCFGAADGDVWELCIDGRSLILKHMQSGEWLGLSEGQPVLRKHSGAAMMGFFADLDKGMAFQLPNGSFLASHRFSGNLIAAPGPLRRDRPSKLFSLQEVALPPHALPFWPLRCHLKTNEELYLSNWGGKLASNAEVPCCAEEFLLDMGGLVEDSALMGRGMWDQAATNIASQDPATGQIFFRSQHACAGRENFNVHLAPRGNAITLNQELDGSSTSLQCGWPVAYCSSDAKATKLTIELAPKPVLLITAHAAAVTLPSFDAAMGLTSLRHHFALDLRAATWQLEHHGDNLYTLRHAATRKLLYLGAAGELRADGSDPVFPSPWTLFKVEAAQVTVQSSESVAGFAITSVARLHGRHLCLSALPDGRIVTAFRGARLSRWELFAIADWEALKGSATEPLSRLLAKGDATALPGMAESHAAANLRRSNSCNAIVTSAAVPIPSPGRPLSPQWGSQEMSPQISSSPTLPGILEHWNEDGEELVAPASAPPRSTISGSTVFPGRRCASEGALNKLQSCVEPTWLAELLHGPTRPCGWGVHSVATMQEQACRSVCATMYVDARESGVKAEVKCHSDLPESVRATLSRELALLEGSPEPTKLSFQHLIKAAAHGNLPNWAEALLSTMEADAMVLEEMAESHCCAACQGQSRMLLPMDEDVNPRHHYFLQAMERRIRGRVRRRRGGRAPDAVVMGMQVAKSGLIFFAAFRCLAALLK